MTTKISIMMMASASASVWVWACQNAVDNNINKVVKAILPLINLALI
jgi:hypothetical protein